MPVDHDKIRRLREQKGWSQQQAADAAGIGSRQRWNDIEAGRRHNLTVETLERVAVALGVKARDLLK